MLAAAETDVKAVTVRARSVAVMSGPPIVEANAPRGLLTPGVRVRNVVVTKEAVLAARAPDRTTRPSAPAKSLARPHLCLTFRLALFPTTKASTLSRAKSR